MANTLETLFLLKQHVLPHIQSWYDIRYFMVAVPLLKKPCIIRIDQLFGVIRDITTQFDPSNIRVTEFESICGTRGYTCDYRYIKSLPYRRLLIFTPTITWTWKPCTHKYAVPVQSAELEFVRPIIDAMWSIIKKKEKHDCDTAEEDPDTETCLRVYIPNSRGLPWCFKASITIQAHYKMNTQGKYKPYLSAIQIDMRPDNPKYRPYLSSTDAHQTIDCEKCISF